MLTYEDCPDIPAHRERAAAFSARFLGDNKTVGRRQAVKLAREGWGVGKFASIKDIERAFDLATAEREVTFSHTATFKVSYNLGWGQRNSDGSNQGARPVSCPMYTRASVESWCERALVRFACRKTEHDHTGTA